MHVREAVRRAIRHLSTFTELVFCVTLAQRMHEKLSQCQASLCEGLREGGWACNERECD